jgi:hypothetical protein
VVAVVEDQGEMPPARLAGFVVGVLDALELALREGALCNAVSLLWRARGDARGILLLVGIGHDVSSVNPFLSEFPLNRTNINVKIWGWRLVGSIEFL